jgi:hypothetical protein
MKTSAAVALALVLTTSAEAEAAPVFLSCVGKSYYAPGEREESYSLEVDMANRKLMLDGTMLPNAVVPISSVSKSTIAAYDSGVLIELNRVTGRLVMLVQNVPQKGIRTFEGTCKPTQKMF